MAIEVGGMLDKYELLEKVGHGGMAVVYRGIDRTLRREVAVKVLHKHLADHKEARDRFEREAQAVAKLRHENILEIFDFSGGDSEDTYIVTEFIDGQTLKEFISENHIKHPEVGALIALQVCQALNHAHHLGILHRDVKPENIMIRNDGVVKLTDFGIAQMVDLQRMTVTGQLLGSPAYMSPEHVEGKPLDFRTDVFSCGILLYQLVTGELPFSGRNPHEILKRIAECRYTPARQVNPLVGKQLGGIIAVAMAQDPDQRYPDISDMLRTLEQYLEDSGLNDQESELARFFAAPASYEMALRTRLLDSLTRRGRELLADNRVAALEMFNRVLTMDPDHPEVLQEIESLSRRRRGARLALLLGGIVLVAGLVFLARALLHGDDEVALPPAADAAMVAAALPPDAAMPTARFDATPALPLTEVVDAAVEVADARAATRPPHNNGRRPPRRTPDAAVEVAPVTRTFTLVVFPRNSEYRVGAGGWTKISGVRATFQAGPGDKTVIVRNRACCQSVKKPLGPTGLTIEVTLGWLPGQITAKCDHAGARVQIGGRAARLSSPIVIPIGSSTTGYRKVEVVFFTEDSSKFDKKQVKVRYKEAKVVTCAF